MPDIHKHQRQHKADPRNPQSHHQWLLERLRNGLLEEASVRAAASLGHKAAQALFPDLKGDLQSALQALPRASQILFACDCAERSQPAFKHRYPLKPILVEAMTRLRQDRIPEVPLPSTRIVEAALSELRQCQGKPSETRTQALNSQLDMFWQLTFRVHSADTPELLGLPGFEPREAAWANMFDSSSALHSAQSFKTILSDPFATSKTAIRALETHNQSLNTWARHNLGDPTGLTEAQVAQAEQRWQRQHLINLLLR